MSRSSSSQPYSYFQPFPEATVSGHGLAPVGTWAHSLTHNFLPLHSSLMVGNRGNGPASGLQWVQADTNLILNPYSLLNINLWFVLVHWGLQTIFIIVQGVQGVTLTPIWSLTYVHKHAPVLMLAHNLSLCTGLWSWQCGPSSIWFRVWRWHQYDLKVMLLFVF